MRNNGWTGSWIGPYPPQSDGGTIAGAVLLEAKLGVGVQVLPPGSHFAVKQIDEMWDLHDKRLHGMLNYYL